MSAVLNHEGGVAFHDLAPPPPLRQKVQSVTAGAGLSYGGPGATRRGTGVAVVLLFHLVLAWLLASGLARQAIEGVKKPLEAVIVTEVPPAPLPPPPLPKVEKIRDLPKPDVPPPPAFVPPPEVAVTPPPAPVIEAVQAEPPQPPPVIAPPAPQPPPGPAVVKQEISVACPGYQTVLAQALEEAVDRVGLTGTVHTLIKIRRSQVVEVVPQSGPKEYYKYVQAAVKRMRCSAGGADEVQVLLPVNFVK